MPKLWNETIDAHRSAVRDAVLEATATLVAEQGLTSVTMSRIAKDSGIGRATLYKYFPDVDSILLAWHERQIAHHLGHLAGVRDRTEGAVARLEAVLRAFALLTRASRKHHDGDLSAFLHRDHRVVEAQRELHGMIEELLAEAARAGAVRDDIAPAELASYCLHALAAAGDLPSEAAVDRLLALTLAGVRPEGAEPSRAPVRTEGTTHPRHHGPGRHHPEPRP